MSSLFNDTEPKEYVKVKRQTRHEQAASLTVLPLFFF